MIAEKRRGRGEGTIRQLANGKWRAWLSAGSKGPGKRHRPSFTADTKRECLAWLRSKQDEQRRGRLSDAGKMTVGEWLDRWLAIKKPQVEPLTWRYYEQRVRLYIRPALGALRLSALTKLAVEEMHAGLCRQGVSPGEQCKVATTLRTALAEAVQSDLIPSNPATRVKRPKARRREIRPMDLGQARLFLDAAQEDRLAAFYDFQLDTGCRPSEAFALHWPDVDWAAGEVFIRQSLEEIEGRQRLKETKTRASRRKIVLAPRTVASLRAHRTRMYQEGHDIVSGPVFIGQRGGLLRRDNVRRDSFRPALERAGLSGSRPYDLRHTCATLLLQAGVNVKVVAERLGHENIETTLRHYAHCLPAMQQAAADAVEAMFGDRHQNGTDGAKPARPENSDAEEE